MSLFGAIKKAVYQAPRLKKRNFDPEKMTIDDIILPNVIVDIDPDAIRDLIKEEVDVYKTLDYKDKPLDQLKINEYHSFQVGLMLRYIKDDKLYLLSNPGDILPSHITYTTKRELHTKVFEVVYRYVNAVDKDASVESLKKDIKWSPQDAGYLLAYLNTQEKYKPKI